jgi:NAD(P)-dependent dehydrogenase (short-subunit alcohol dehydrogenase family)
MKLHGKTAIISGAGTGIGAATAKLFAAEGARITLTGRRPGPLQEVVGEIEAAGGTAQAVAGDVADRAHCRDLVAETLAAYGRLDILFANAGSGDRALVVETTEELWDQTMNTNLKGTFLCVQAALPTMQEQNGGVIVTMSSILGQSGLAQTSAYSATKAGIEQFTKVVALEGAPYGIRANAVAPGWVETPLTEGAQKDEALLARIPQTRFGRPEEIAHAVLYLASDDARWVTGTVLTIDGGWQAG